MPIILNLIQFLSGKIQKREGENADEPSADDVLKQEVRFCVC